jgi:hypothetical protein
VVVGFADITDPELTAPVICHALGLAERPELTPAQRLQGYLRDRELLLVLDNLEQLAPGVMVLGELLAGCPGVRMLVTSRVPLQLSGEQQYEVPVLDHEDAIELFTVRAKAVAPGVRVDRDVASAICERLDRLPLAIELAAARTKLFSRGRSLIGSTVGCPCSAAVRATHRGASAPCRRQSTGATACLPRRSSVCTCGFRCLPAAARRRPPRPSATPSLTRWEPWSIAAFCARVMVATGCSRR